LTSGVAPRTHVKLHRLRVAAPVSIVLAALFLIPQFVNPYQTLLLTYGLVMAIAALGFNLLLGYTGLLSFGHSAYFGTGAYAVALLARYMGVSSMELFVVGGIVASAAISALFGLICVRHTRIFFAVLALALSQVLWTLAYKFYWITNGTDGLNIPFPKLLGGLFEFSGSGAYQRFVFSYYYYVAVIFCVVAAIMWLIVSSPFGQALQAIRDNEIRAEFIGLKVRLYRWIAFLISGTFTGLAGALWIPLNRHVTPEVLYWPFSGEIVFMTVLGGFKSFSGPIIGAIAFNYLKTYAIAWTEYWQFLLGSVLVLMVLALPTGIMGLAEWLLNKIRVGKGA
jgi:branched-chain amino acid transport system permease protein